MYGDVVDCHRRSGWVDRKCSLSVGFCFFFSLSWRGGFGVLIFRWKSWFEFGLVTLVYETYGTGMVITAPRSTGPTQWRHEGLGLGFRARARTWPVENYIAQKKKKEKYDITLWTLHLHPLNVTPGREAVVILQPRSTTWYCPYPCWSQTTQPAVRHYPSPQFT